MGKLVLNIFNNLENVRVVPFRNSRITPETTGDDVIQEIDLLMGQSITILLAERMEIFIYGHRQCG